MRNHHAQNSFLQRHPLAEDILYLELGFLEGRTVYHEVLSEQLLILLDQRVHHILHEHFFGITGIRFLVDLLV